MTNPGMPPLLDADDYATFESLDVDWFIVAASAAIRRFCGWHVYPALTESKSCTMGGDGTIILPTCRATSVVSVQLPWNGQIIGADKYWLDADASAIRWRCGGPSGWWGANSIGSTTAYPKYPRKVFVEFTHGYDELPPEVAEAAAELVMRTIEKPAGVAQSIKAGPYSFRMGDYGLLLNEQQKSRLSAYKLPAIF